MDLKFEIIPSFVLHTFLLIYLAQDTSTLFMDLKFEHIPSFVLHTFHLIYLAQDTYAFPMIGNLKIFQVLSFTLFM